MPPRKPSPVGVHVPVAGGLASGGLSYARDIGAEAVQVFLSNPRGWALSAGDARQDDEFRSGCVSAKIPAFVHAPYLVNLGSPTETTLENSVRSLRHTLARAGAIGAHGVVVHAGSVIGDDCTLRHGVTIGNRTPDGPLPVIGNNVEIGCGAIILGGITIGDGARIGAGAIVVKDVPPGAVALSAPATVS